MERRAAQLESYATSFRDLGRPGPVDTWERHVVLALGNAYSLTEVTEQPNMVI